jgi:hypothetical protein
MKKTTTLLLLLSLFTYSVFAQPVISQSNMPQLGDHVVIGICSDSVTTTSVGNAGAMQTWDMSGLNEISQEFFDYIDPLTSIEPDSFPNASICSVSWLDDYSYYNITSSSLTAEGYLVTINPFDTGTTVYTDPEKILELPYTFGDNFVDNFAGSNYLTNFGIIDFTGSLDFEADGYGTLILPNGIFTNVVRYHFYREQTNYVGGFPSTTQTKDQWAWVSEDYRFWLLLMETTFDGFSTSSLVWYDKNPYSVLTGIKSAAVSEASVYPNPLRVGQSPVIKWERTESVSVSCVGYDGKLLASRQIVLNKGANTIDFFNLSAGMYIIRVESPSLNYNQRISVLH